MCKNQCYYIQMCIDGTFYQKVLLVFKYMNTQLCIYLILMIPCDTARRGISICKNNKYCHK